jgi:hypothetical protein
VATRRPFIADLLVLATESLITQFLAGDDEPDGGRS